MAISFGSEQDYLEIKRMIFPRFYFLSNAELLDILADSRNPESVQVILLFSVSDTISQPGQNFIVLLTLVSGPQPHLMKCFENIKQLLIWKQEMGPPAVIMLVSAEGETLLLPK